MVGSRDGLGVGTIVGVTDGTEGYIDGVTLGVGVLVSVIVGVKPIVTVGVGVNVFVGVTDGHAP